MPPGDAGPPGRRLMPARHQASAATGRSGAISITRPSATRYSRSATSRNAGRWVIARTAIASASARMPWTICHSVSGSRALVTSSRISSRGFETRARASAIRWRCPPDSLGPGFADLGHHALGQGGHELPGAGELERALGRRICGCADRQARRWRRPCRGTAPAPAARSPRDAASAAHRSPQAARRRAGPGPGPADRGRGSGRRSSSCRRRTGRSARSRPGPAPPTTRHGAPHGRHGRSSPLPGGIRARTSAPADRGSARAQRRLRSPAREPPDTRSRPSPPSGTTAGSWRCRWWSS